MMIRRIALIFLVFMLGFFANNVVMSALDLQEIQNPFGAEADEIAGPADRISDDNVRLYSDRVVIYIKNPEWAAFTDTNSMDPVLDIGAVAVQIVPQSPDEIYVGDIVSYTSRYAEGTIIHRVVYKGSDEEGPYFVMKGDNLPTSDPGKVRFEDIKKVVVAIIY